jgi:hypothetical protein
MRGFRNKCENECSADDVEKKEWNRTESEREIV